MENENENDNDNEPMNIKTALEILDIDLDEIEISQLNHEFVKRKYHKLALLWHPDKNKNSNYAKEKFQKINQAYEYLLKELHFSTQSNSSSLDKDKDSKTKYAHFLSMFISGVIIGDYNDLIKSVINEIVMGCGKISVKLFENLDKENALEVYRFLCKYKTSLHMSNYTLELVANVIKEKYKNDQVFILNPSLRDLMENNLYKLWVDGQLYLVPLWHNELYFDGPNKTDIIVVCNPELPKDISVDENNNLHMFIKLRLEDVKNLIFCDGSIEFSLDTKLFKVPVRDLRMKKEQIYKIKGQGLSRICEKDIYSVSLKGDLFVNIVLE
jgi:hypothetical protein